MSMKHHDVVICIMHLCAHYIIYFAQYFHGKNSKNMHYVVLPTQSDVTPAHLRHIGFYSSKLLVMDEILCQKLY